MKLSETSVDSSTLAETHHYRPWKPSICGPQLRSSNLDSVVKTKCNLNNNLQDQGCKETKSVFYVSAIHPTKSRDPGQNPLPQSPAWHVGQHMLSHKHHHHHSLPLQTGRWQGQRKELSPPRYLTHVWTPQPALGTVAPVATVLWEIRGVFLRIGCKSHASRRATGVRTLRSVFLWGEEVWIKCAEEEEVVEN